MNDGGTSSNVIGYFEVSSVILINYLGLIFNAMSFDFFPKLSSISKDNVAIKKLVNNQIEIAIILVTPAVILLYLAGPLFIQLLYSKAFLNSFLILKIALFSVILKSVIFPLGYIVLAKGDKKLFFKQALLSDSLNLFFSIVLYKYYGLIGLGVAYVLNYAIYGVYIYYVTNKYYDFASYAMDKGASIELLMVIEKIKETQEALKKLKKDDFVNASALFNSAKDLHNAYYLSLIGQLSVTGKILDADGD